MPARRQDVHAHEEAHEGGQHEHQRQVRDRAGAGVPRREIAGSRCVPPVRHRRDRLVLRRARRGPWWGGGRTRLPDPRPHPAQRPRSDDPIRLQRLGALEPHDGALGQRAEQAIHGPGPVVELAQRPLHPADTLQTALPVAVPEGDRDR